MEHQPLRAAIYASDETQETQCARHCIDHDYDIVAVALGQYARLCDAVTTVATGRADVVVVAQLTQLTLAWAAGCQTTQAEVADLERAA